jgi:hypothetical protein
MLSLATLSLLDGSSAERVPAIQSGWITFVSCGRSWKFMADFCL